jgi:SAM-dependent methyltransferase
MRIIFKMGRLIELLKSIPIDFGQGTLRTTTKGKIIAMSCVPDGDGARALDVGCREGHQSRWLESKGYIVTPIDVEKSYEKATIVDANGPLPYPSQTFSLIWCSEVIEHLKSPESFLQEVDRILVPGGRLVLTTPNSAFWLYWLIGLFGMKPKDVQHPGHLHFFNLTDIRKLFPDCKIMGFFPYIIFRFKITSLVGALSPTFIVSRDSL